jgi:hypothetical protein
VNGIFAATHWSGLVQVTSNNSHNRIPAGLVLLTRKDMAYLHMHSKIRFYQAFPVVAITFSGQSTLFHVIPRKEYHPCLTT